VATKKGHIKNMKKWQHTSGTIYIRWIKFGVDGGNYNVWCQESCVSRSRNLSTITRDIM